MDKKFCTECGAEIADGKRFCTACGAAAKDEAGAPDAPAAAPPPAAAPAPAAAVAAPPRPAPPPPAAPVYQQPAPAYQPAPPPVYQQPAPAYAPPGYAAPGGDAVPAKGSRYEPISTGGYIGISLLMAIPLVGIILAIVWACGGCRKINKRNFARAMLILMVISLILCAGLYFAGRAVWKNVMEKSGMNDLMEQYGITSFGELGSLGELGNLGELGELAEQLSQLEGLQSGAPSAAP